MPHPKTTHPLACCKGCHKEFSSLPAILSHLRSTRCHEGELLKRYLQLNNATLKEHQSCTMEKQWKRQFLKILHSPKYHHRQGSMRIGLHTSTGPRQSMWKVDLGDRWKCLLLDKSLGAPRGSYDGWRMRGPCLLAKFLAFHKEARIQPPLKRVGLKF